MKQEFEYTPDRDSPREIARRFLKTPPFELVRIKVLPLAQFKGLLPFDSKCDFGAANRRHLHEIKVGGGRVRHLIDSIFEDGRISCGKG